MNTRITMSALAAAAGILASLEVAAATTVRGRLDQYTGGKLSPAAFVQVTLTASGQEVSSGVTGSDGMYYLRRVSPGRCTLRIWLQDVGDTSKGGLMQYEIKATESKYTNVRPILVNRLDFSAPDSGYSCAAGVGLAFSGTHTFPDGAPVALLLKTHSGGYFRLKPTLGLVARAPWRFTDVQVEAGTVEVLAVLFADEPAVKVNPQARGMSNIAVQSFRGVQGREPDEYTEQSCEGRDVLDALPKSAIVLGSRKVTVQ